MRSSQAATGSQMKSSSDVMGRRRRRAVVPDPPGSERRSFTGSSTIPSGAGLRSCATPRSTVAFDRPR
ncbi:hypothetical protein [Streptomyces sp. NPDC088348]|uniref:hypothetical protein n=1 Tax=Streptomyces sp. NPDC088348 TaxID=3365853 RepID=UPI00382525ED